jgi:hypothetical protein
VKIPLLNPILNVCHNISFGDFIKFEGAYGSGRSEAVI